MLQNVNSEGLARGRTRTLRSERGSASIELSIVGPVFLMFFVFLAVYAGTVIKQRSDVQSAAHAAARAGTIWDNPGIAAAEAEAVGRENLAESGISCIGGGSVSAETGSMVGTDLDNLGFVSVTIRCSARPIGFFSPQEYEATAVEIVDFWRSGP